MKKCYIYSRVSTAAQVEGYSLEAQEERLLEYAQYKGLKVVGNYCDAGKSGKSIKGRPEFQRMLEDIMSEKDSISYVLVFKLSRFGRNAADVLKSLQLLNDFGADLVCVEDAIDSSTQGGKLTLSILSAVAEIERENISIQFMSGRLQSIKDGGWYGGPIPYGYRSGQNGLIVEPYEAEIVRLVFDLYLQDGMSVLSVTNWLNEHGYRRIRNDKEEPFTRDSINHILRNPVSCGKLKGGVLCRHGISVDDMDPDSGLIEGKQEAIVSEEQWRKAQEKLVRCSRKHRKREDTDRISLLSGLVKCPKCGAGMYALKSKKVNSNHGGYYKIVYEYGCMHHRKSQGRRCNFDRQYNQERLDAAVLEILQSLSVTKEFKEEVARQMGGQEDESKLKDEISTLRKTLRNLELKKIQLGDDLDHLDILDDGYDDRYDEIQARIDSTYDSIEEIEEDLRRRQKSLDALRKGIHGGEQAFRMMDHLMELYEHMTCMEKREMFRLLIERIDVEPDRGCRRLVRGITFNIPVYYDGQEMQSDRKRALYGRIVFSLDCSKRDLTRAEARATYEQIKVYIREKYGVKVTDLYIAQIKRKYGLDMRKNYYIKKDPNTRTVQCTPEKEAMIVDALKHFKMLEPDAIPVLEVENGTT